MRFTVPLFLVEWKRAGASMRYFLATHLLANTLMMATSIASVVYGALGSRDPQMLLLVAAVLCGGQAILSWTVLQRRFKLRYSLW